MRYPTREYQNDSSSLSLSRSDDWIRTTPAPAVDVTIVDLDDQLRGGLDLRHEANCFSEQSCKRNARRGHTARPFHSYEGSVIDA